METAADITSAQNRLSLSDYILWLIPLAPADQHLVGGGLEREAEAEQALEGGVRGAPAVEPEHELVQVGLEVLLAQAVVDPQRPPLRVREHPMDPGRDQVGRD